MRPIPEEVVRLGPEEARRARLTVFGSVAVFFGQCVVAAVLKQHGYSAAETVALAAPVQLLPILVLWTTRSARIAAHCLLLIIMGVIAWDFGPGDRFSVLGLIIMPTVGAMLVGVRGGIGWTIVAVLWALIGEVYFVRPEDATYVLLAQNTAILAASAGVASILNEMTRARSADDAQQVRGHLQTQQDAMRSFVESAFPVYVETTGLTITMVSDGALKILGYRREDVLGLTLDTFLHAEDLETAMVPGEHPNAAHRLEGRIRHADGTWLWLEGFAVPLTRDTDPRTRKWIYAGRDAQQERRSRERLLRAQRLEGVGVMAAGISHDFNNLLTVINGFAELLPASEERANILQAANEASTLTASLTAFGKHSQSLDRSIDAVASIKKWHPMFRSLLGERIELVYDLPREAGAAVGEGQLNQVLLNLVTNAKEAMGDGGRLSLSVGVERLVGGAATDRGLEEGPFVRITVADTGCGMATSVAERAFDPFFSTKATASGSGLGLSSVYGIVQQQRGYVEILTEQGVGTQVVVLLPHTPVTVTQEIASVGSSADGQSATVVLVEDDDLVRSLVERTLQRNGYDLRSFARGDEAVAWLSENTADLLITDIILVDTRGTEVAKSARAQDPEIPVLFMSGYTDTEIGDWRSQRDQRTRFIAKPFRADQLIEEASKLVDIRAKSPGVALQK